MNIRQLAEQAKSQMAEITGLKPLNVIEIFKDQRGWHVGLDMLEMSRIPTATDILGEYEILMDDEGNALTFVRKRTRLRGEPMEKGENG